MKDLPEIDIVVSSPNHWLRTTRCQLPRSEGLKDKFGTDPQAISHNHYDHCDLNTLKELYAKHADRPPVLFVGLNGAANLRSTVGPKTDIVEMDWWEDRVVNVEGKGNVKVTCSEWSWSLEWSKPSVGDCLC